ncbi:MAG: hypothetical protein QG629_708 [Patescibacteria group bacterium]|nr:CapA family protein [Candidatus Saccharibacteria bacterium]MDQ5963625.1 hypothetical protein [Patescibacteria group bacterium]
MRHPNLTRRQIATITLVVSVLVIGICLWIGLQRHSNTPDTTNARTVAKPAPAKYDTAKQPQTVTFAAMGDMLAHDSIVSSAKADTGYDFGKYFANIRGQYQGVDVVFCNPETLAVGPDFGISGYPTFNGPHEFADSLVRDGGCNLINLATNHINDKGQAALDANSKLWDGRSVLAYTGANRSAEEQQQVKYFTKNGMKIAFLAFADYSNNTSLTPYGLNSYHDTALFSRLLTEARSKADLVVLSMHWGTEDSTTVNTDQQQAAQLAADLGVDVLIGTGPHVLQKTTWVSGKNGHKTLVWYSIGNMLSSQLQVNELTGIIAKFEARKDPQTSKVALSNLQAQATFMSYAWSSADRAAGRLDTRNDFKLQTLQSAGDNPAKMFGQQYSFQERLQYIQSTLSTEAGVKVLP